MGSNEAMIDNYLDWYFKDDYIWDDVNKEYVYNDTKESEVKDV